MDFSQFMKYIPIDKIADYGVLGIIFIIFIIIVLKTLIFGKTKEETINLDNIYSKISDIERDIQNIKLENQQLRSKLSKKYRQLYNLFFNIEENTKGINNIIKEKDDIDE